LELGLLLETDGKLAQCELDLVVERATRRGLDPAGAQCPPIPVVVLERLGEQLVLVLEVPVNRARGIPARFVTCESVIPSYPRSAAISNAASSIRCCDSRPCWWRRSLFLSLLPANGSPSRVAVVFGAPASVTIDIGRLVREISL